MPYVSVLTDENEEGGRTPIPVGLPFTIGRGAGASLRIRDLKMSRVHCELSVSGGIAILTDLGSMNGTYLNGKRVGSTVVKDGDVMQVGYTRFRYHEAELGPPAVAAARAPKTAQPAKGAAGNVKPAPAAGRPAARPGQPAPQRPVASAATRPMVATSSPARPTPPKPAARPVASKVASPPPRPPAPAAREIAFVQMDEQQGPDDRSVAGLLRIVSEKAARPLRKGEFACCSCRQAVASKEVKGGAATNVHGQVCCPKCISEDPLIGKTIAGYRVDAKLGSGPWSTTYKAEQLSMARAVVLRIVRFEVAADSELVTQFLAAVKRGGQISHPNLVRIYDIGRAEGLCYASTEFIDGENLTQAVPRKPALAMGAAVQIALDVAGAVDIAHRKDVFHRDIRPSNIILNDEGIPKLTGLGFARSIEEAAASGAAKFRHATDTVRWWAPECLVEPAHASRQADVYSLGAVLYALLSGQPPFGAEDPVELVREIRSLRPKALDAVRPGIPHRLVAVVAKALAKAPADRYADCQQFMQDLRGAMG